MSPCNVCLNSILIKTSLFNEFKINNAFDIMINLTELNTILKNIKKDSMLTLNINNLTDISITLDFLKVTETINATDEKLGDF
jgi:hypothetical protein